MRKPIIKFIYHISLFSIMDGKQVGAIIGLIVAIPLLINLLSWTIKNTNDSGNPENLEEGVEIIADSAIPWCLGIFEWLAELPGIITAILIMGFIRFLKWIGEIK